MNERSEYLALLTEEYRRLAASGDQMDRHTYTALQWGTAVVGILAGAAISQWGQHDAAVELAFLSAIPALIVVGMLYWIGELARMRRLYDFMCVVEAKAELAFQHEGSNADSEGWPDSFDQERLSVRDKIFSELELSVPASDRGEVHMAGGPIVFERWLRSIRSTHASSNLTWVFLVRFLLFPLAAAASWSFGMYYVFFQSADGVLGWGSIAAALVGLSFGFISVWLAGELVTDLNQSSSQPLHLSWLRRTFRQRIGVLLQITEWQR